MFYLLEFLLCATYTRFLHETEPDGVMARRRRRQIGGQLVCVSTWLCRFTPIPWSWMNPWPLFFILNSHVTNAYATIVAYDCWFFFKINHTINQHGHKFLLFNIHTLSDIFPPRRFFFASLCLPALRKTSQPPKRQAFLTPSAGRQRTLTMKQQLLRKSCKISTLDIIVYWHCLPRARKGF